MSYWTNNRLFSPGQHCLDHWLIPHSNGECSARCHFTLVSSVGIISQQTHSTRGRDMDRLLCQCANRIFKLLSFRWFGLSAYPYHLRNTYGLKRWYCLLCTCSAVLIAPAGSINPHQYDCARCDEFRLFDLLHYASVGSQLVLLCMRVLGDCLDDRAVGRLL